MGDVIGLGKAQNFQFHLFPNYPCALNTAASVS